MEGLQRYIHIDAAYVQKLYDVHVYMLNQGQKACDAAPTCHNVNMCMYIHVKYMHREHVNYAHKMSAVQCTCTKAVD